MAITKILARHARLDVGIQYALNGDKTGEKVYTAYQNCTPYHPYYTMKKTKEQYKKTVGVQSYHIIQSFVPGEIEPEQALEIAKSFAAQHLSKFQAVIGVHQDKNHIHAHIVFNSDACTNGHKYHSSPKSYFEQIRGVSDKLCKEYGLSVIMQGETSKTVTYYEWLMKSKGVSTIKDMLKADITLAIDQAAEYGNFLMLMEHMGYEIKHGNRLSIKLRGTEKYYCPDRQDGRFSESGIRSVIEQSHERR